VLSGGNEQVTCTVAELIVTSLLLAERSHMPTSTLDSQSGYFMHRPHRHVGPMNTCPTMVTMCVTSVAYFELHNTLRVRLTMYANKKYVRKRCKTRVTDTNDLVSKI